MYSLSLFFVVGLRKKKYYRIQLQPVCGKQAYTSQPTKDLECSGRHHHRQIQGKSTLREQVNSRASHTLSLSLAVPLQRLTQPEIGAEGMELDMECATMTALVDVTTRQRDTAAAGLVSVPESTERAVSQYA